MQVTFACHRILFALERLHQPSPALTPLLKQSQCHHTQFPNECTLEPVSCLGQGCVATHSGRYRALRPRPLPELQRPTPRAHAAVVTIALPGQPHVWAGTVLDHGNAAAHLGQRYHALRLPSLPVLLADGRALGPEPRDVAAAVVGAPGRRPPAPRVRLGVVLKLRTAGRCIAII